MFIDKNHPANALSRVVSDITSSLRPTTDRRILYLIPELGPKEALFEDYPFSASFILQTFSRGINRTGHETIDNSDPIKTLEIMNMFLSMTTNVQYDNKFLRQQSLDGFLKIPMSVPLDVPGSLLKGLAT